MEEMKKLHPEGTDVIIDATGIEECIQNCLKLCKKGGTVVLAGYGRGKIMNIRIDDIHINNLPFFTILYGKNKKKSTKHF